MGSLSGATTSDEGPIAIGAIGGSGTRIIARLMRDLGYYMGGDLNPSNDNLWFTLLFKRPNILIEPRTSFNDLANIFYRRMAGLSFADETITRLVTGIAEQPRPQHDRPWLSERADTLLRTIDSMPPHRAWGWKEPNTHVVIDRLLDFDRRLRYIHVVRNGLDMAFSRNQNQLRLWGPTFLGREVEETPRDSLAYWCAVQRRTQKLARWYDGRVMLLDFDRFCTDPARNCSELLGFIHREASQELIEAFAATVVIPDSLARFRCEPVSSLEPADVAYVAQCGYPVD